MSSTASSLSGILMVLVLNQATESVLLLDYWGIFQLLLFKECQTKIGYIKCNMRALVFSNQQLNN
jgi:hypothetical protein